jgi:hypothetical protein
LTFSTILPEDVIEDLTSEVMALIIIILHFLWHQFIALLRFDKAVCLHILKHWRTILTITFCVLTLDIDEVCYDSISSLSTIDINTYKSESFETCPPLSDVLPVIMMNGTRRLAPAPHVESDDESEFDFIDNNKSHPASNTLLELAVPLESNNISQEPKVRGNNFPPWLQGRSFDDYYESDDEDKILEDLQSTAIVPLIVVHPPSDASAHPEILYEGNDLGRGASYYGGVTYQSRPNRSPLRKAWLNRREQYTRETGPQNRADLRERAANARIKKQDGFPNRERNSRTEPSRVATTDAIEKRIPEPKKFETEASEAKASSELADRGAKSESHLDAKDAHAKRVRGNVTKKKEKNSIKGYKAGRTNATTSKSVIFSFKSSKQATAEKNRKRQPSIIKPPPPSHTA